MTTVEQDEATQQSFDGDGRRVMFYDDLNTIDGTNHRLYFVRSTALGGQILDEVNPSGQKQRAYVYAGGSPLATQEGTGSQVRWEHRDPNSAGIYSTDASGALASHGEYDPLGVSAPDVPGLTMVNNSPYNSGSFGTPDMGCNVDRIPTPCTMARRWEASGVPSTTVTYYLRSTVLGGKIVAQYNSAGGRQSSYAWAARCWPSRRGQTPARRHELLLGAAEGLAARVEEPVGGHAVKAEQGRARRRPLRMARGRARAESADPSRRARRASSRAGRRSPVRAVQRAGAAGKSLSCQRRV